jgi:hypothetical protein
MPNLRLRTLREIWRRRRALLMQLAAETSEVVAPETAGQAQEASLAGDRA